MGYKIPISVLVVIYTPKLDILILERADKSGFWQSVTGSLDTPDEPLAMAAAREVKEETGIDVTVDQAVLQDWKKSIEYEIYPYWRYRYAAHVLRNTEHWFGLEVPCIQAITLAAREHVQYRWLPYQEAAGKCFSRSNQEAILALPRHIKTSCA